MASSTASRTLTRVLSRTHASVFDLGAMRGTQAVIDGRIGKEGIRWYSLVGGHGRVAGASTGGRSDGRVAWGYGRGARGITSGQFACDEEERSSTKGGEASGRVAALVRTRGERGAAWRERHRLMRDEKHCVLLPILTHALARSLAHSLVHILLSFYFRRTVSSNSTCWR